MLSRNTQINQNYLVEHVTPTAIGFQQAFQSLRFRLPQLGVNPSVLDETAFGAIYREVQRQALMLSFNNSFMYLFLIFFIVVPLLFMLRRAYGGDAAPVH
jgi:hypothetical protein